ncbi:bifunctional lysylphosphatidylglycerol synthetase/lysine--tRNA ligase LysX [Mycobacteroides abscessus]|uniref:Lysine--tRNA ligase n=1 Tax=Mycobacteroides abscessus subsp. bolletii 1513 TaxID=1299321 RepID=X8DNP2_9MYCO|nr:bifunctional lysylphosphatidylglycerol synthetase/lysine--tRNA ligase LysX [Mycobacteroides abscessus]EUA70227.1 lysine--tRNA ligase [Mycobacteroides abscessus subsp. bolletii 1513]EIU18780.1 lysine--tRNA ligase [Mycobacteroides abscessus 5S-0422]EIU32952.1 lysine--tRNA ligase [Mycobacteroides abscessus 5S-1212]MBN7495681.1 bifunctional lysylphosphatidylglycerol synthetase/lysine--tRNA ligase LysX [Mycobacteroides abscessus subsp. abscessus]MDM2645944.1 bifunctional lysylphosphatidylglycero
MTSIKPAVEPPAPDHSAVTVLPGIGARPAARPPVTSRWRWVPAFFGWFVGIQAILNFLSSISPFIRMVTKLPREFVDEYLFGWPDGSLSWAFVLSLLAAALAVRKSIAWWVLLIDLLGRSALNVGGFIEHRDTTELVGLVVHGAFILLLLLARKEFYAKVRRGATVKAALVLIAGMAAGTVLAWGLLELFPRTLVPGDRFWWALNRVAGFSIASHRDFDGLPPHFLNWLFGLFGALALIAAAIVLFRSQRAVNALTGDDESLIRGLLERYGQDDSLGYFATRRDKAVIFAPNGRAAVTYRVEVGVCLVSADPIGDKSAWGQAISAWLQVCDAYGWAPAVMGASAEGALAYREHGLNALELGDEAILYPRSFSISGPHMAAVRQAVNRARRSGLSVRIRRHRELSAEDTKQIIVNADLWRDGNTERGFSMALGRLGDSTDGDCLLVEAIDSTGDPVAMLSLVPWGTNGVSLELMRRSRQSPNGTIEFMVTELLTRAEGMGITRVSLNFVMFRSVYADGSRIGAGPVLRLWRSVLMFASRFWQFEQLYRSNVKYQPEWVPRFACYEDARLIPRIGIASVIAEGFLVLPFGNRDKPRHTGQYSAVPQAIVATGLLHHDGSTPELLPQTAPQQRVPEQVKVRLGKLAALQEKGIDAYPVGSPPSHTVAEALAAPDGSEVVISGRLLRIRDYGGVLFAQLRDWSAEVQLLIDDPRLHEEFTAAVDLGDLVEASGVMGQSNNGTRSVLVKSWRIIGKCLHPLPDKRKGLTDPEARVRARYLDLAINPEAREQIAARSAIITSLRNTLLAQGFLEVETPILQQVHGGANARPFLTHINAYNLDLYLRIAPELYLKRLCVGGVEKVFELGRAFRNEGVDFSHNPEFTLLEAYQAHADYVTWAKTTQRLIQNAAKAAHGAEVVMRPGVDGRLAPVDIGGEWPIVPVHEAVSHALGEEVNAATEVPALRRFCQSAEVQFNPRWDAGHLVLELYERLVEKHTTSPTFYSDFPVSVSPLTRPHRSITGLAERWDLVAWGVELGTAYTELTDPVEQRRRLYEQSLLAAGGDAEAMELDEDFLRAMEYAMAPTGGMGMGVDRVVMLITGRSIRETLPFPLAKPR